MAESKLEILIETVAKTAGIQLTKEQLDEVKGKVTELEPATAKTGMRMTELRHIFSELNQVTPGLGMAMRGLIGQMGEVAVVVLAIQAAVTWWKFFHDEEKALLEQHSEELEKFQKATKAALDEFFEFQKKLAAAELINDPFKAELVAIEAVRKASSLAAEDKATDADKAKEKVIKRLEEEALAVADNEQLKKQITERATAEIEKIEADAAKRKKDREKNEAKQAIDDELEEQKRMISEMETLGQTGRGLRGARDARRQRGELTPELDKQIADLDDRFAALTGKVTGLGQDIWTKQGSFAARYNGTGPVGQSPAEQAAAEQERKDKEAEAAATSMAWLEFRKTKEVKAQASEYEAGKAKAYEGGTNFAAPTEGGATMIHAFNAKMDQQAEAQRAYHQAIIDKLDKSIAQLQSHTSQINNAHAANP